MNSSPEGFLADQQDNVIAAMRDAGIDATRKDHPEDHKMPLGPSPRTSS